MFVVRTALTFRFFPQEKKSIHRRLYSWLLEEEEQKRKLSVTVRSKKQKQCYKGRDGVEVVAEGADRSAWGLLWWCCTCYSSLCILTSVSITSSLQHDEGNVCG